MSYLNFDKTVLVNLERSLQKEMIRTNRAGVYNSTTLVDCNTRKYHGQLVMPIPQLGEDNFVLLSSLDETVIQHGAEFNLGLHEYSENHFSQILFSLDFEKKPKCFRSESKDDYSAKEIYHS